MSESRSSAACAVCRRIISLTAAGVVRFHGPVASRCPGSRRPPTTTEALISSSSSRGLQRDDPGRQPTTTEALLSSPSSRGLQRDDPGGQPSQTPLEALLPLPPRCESESLRGSPGLLELRRERSWPPFWRP